MHITFDRRQFLGAATAAVLAAAGPALIAASPATAAPSPTAPPPVTVLAGSASRSDGDIFISPFGDQSTYANGPEILSSDGKVVWFHAVPTGEEASDFRAQTYDGQPVLILASQGTSDVNLLGPAATILRPC